MSSAVDASRLGRRYGRRWGLRDCSLSLPEGRVVALVGPNGAGKSTLLSLLAGLLRPSEGELRVLGGPVARRLPDVAHMAPDSALFPSFTTEDLLAFGRRLNPRWDGPWARDRLRDLDVPPGVPARGLSGGQRAKVALVLALAKRPRLLLLDEPLASLDPVARHDVMALLMRVVAETGVTLVLSSHIIADLEDTCDWMVAINRGQVQVSGPVDGLLDGHRLLTGPAEALSSLPGRLPVVASTVSGRQASVLARLGSHRPDPVWTVREPALEDLVLAYLRAPAHSALPGPMSAVPTRVS